MKLIRNSYETHKVKLIISAAPNRIVQRRLSSFSVTLVPEVFFPIHFSCFLARKYTVEHDYKKKKVKIRQWLCLQKHISSINNFEAYIRSVFKRFIDYHSKKIQIIIIIKKIYIEN